MRKAVALTGTGVVAAGAVFVGTTVASAGSDQPNITRPVTIHVIDTDQKVALHDINKKGLDFGDILVFRSIVSDPSGRQVGHGIGQVDIQGPHDNLLVYTMVLADGDITMQGDIRGIQPGATSQLAVTGGTGRYGNARGVTDARQIGNGATDLVVHLIP